MPRAGSASASPCCGWRWRSKGGASTGRGRRTRRRGSARPGRRTSAGSGSRGGSTPPARWVGSGPPVLRVRLETHGRRFDSAGQAPEAAGLGQVWEEDEFWIELSWRIDPDGALGIRKYFESPYRPGEKLRIEEFYRWIFENSVPGLTEAGSAVGWTPLASMRR